MNELMGYMAGGIDEGGGRYYDPYSGVGIITLIKAACFWLDWP